MLHDVAGAIRVVPPLAALDRHPGAVDQHHRAIARRARDLPAETPRLSIRHTHRDPAQSALATGVADPATFNLDLVS
jgi:hypothetical protein